MPIMNQIGVTISMPEFYRRRMDLWAEVVASVIRKDGQNHITACQTADSVLVAFDNKFNPPPEQGE